MTISISNSLQGIKVQVAALIKIFPKTPMASVPKAEIQIPWICQTLDEAASAYETKKDPFGNPITMAQISSGLRQLLIIVREPSYITQMEMAYPGIGKPLKDCMNELERVINSIKST